MYHITRLRIWRYPSRLSFAHWGPRPVLRLSPPQTREQHDIAHSQAPPLPSRPQQDVQRPLPPVKESETPLQDGKLNTDDNHAGPAQEVPQQSFRTAMADGAAAHPASLPFVCSHCGAKFRVQGGLNNHQKHHGQAGGCKDKFSVAGMKVNSHVLKFQDPRDLGLTLGLGEKIYEISSQGLEPSLVPVSQDSGYQVISTFNAVPRAASPISVPGPLPVAMWWHLCPLASGLSFPYTIKTDQDTTLIGSAPSLKDSQLPIDLHEAVLKKIQPGEQKSDELNMLMLSLRATPPEFRYDGVDIVTHGLLLVRLLNFCKGKQTGTRRISLRMIQGSLFVADDPLMKAPGGARSAAFKSAIEDHCTEMAPGLERSGHYRSVQYKLGHIKCVVQRKVDALCNTRAGELPPSLLPSSSKPLVSRGSHPQGEAAEIRLQHQDRSSNKRVVQMEPSWFSRIPVILIACLTREGSTLTEMRKLDVTAGLRRFEEKHQLALRKLATLLSELKRIVKAAAPDGQECFGLIERHLDPPTIQLFLSEDESKMVPGDIRNNPSVGEMTSHGSDEASEGERQGPTSQV